MASPRYNLNNPSVKRILQEVKEMQSNPSDDYMSLPLEENIYEWQFAIRGPPDSEFEGGIYHGRIQLPPEYPFKPPAFMLLTPNGRFETQTKICLSISQYHPEHWQPSWSVRTALVALIAFMPTKANGAIGSLEFSKEERRALATKSIEAPPKYGTPERQKVIDEIHKEMLRRGCSHTTAANGEDTSTVIHSDKNDTSTMNSNDMNDTSQPAEYVVETCVDATQSSSADISSVEIPHPQRSMTPLQTSMTPRVEDSSNVEPVTTVLPPPRRQQTSEDQFLTLLAIGLVVALVALVMKKALASQWWANFGV